MAWENPQWHHLGTLQGAQHSLRTPGYVMMKLLAGAKHIDNVIEFCTRKKPVHSQNQSGSWQMTADIRVCPWPNLSILRVRHLRFSFSQVSPFRNSTQIIINQISNRIKSNQHRINSNHVAIFVRCQELFAWAPISKVFFYIWLCVEVDYPKNPMVWHLIFIFSL
jgi:hypothetical protein